MNQKRSLRTFFVAMAVAICLVAGAAFAEGGLTPEAAKMNLMFEEAAAEFDVPVELLQSIGYTESRWRHIIPENEEVFEDANVTDNEEGARPLIGPSRHKKGEARHQPAAYGVMGLRDDDHFGHSLRTAAALIGLTPEELKADARQNIRGAAALLSAFGEGKTATTPIEQWEDAVARFSGIPQPRIAEMHTYDILNTIISGPSGDRFRVKQRELDLVQVYGGEKLKVLSAPRLTVDVRATPVDGEVSASSTDYGPALYDQAPTCNYSAGRSSGITHIAEHIAQGSYAGTISWFNNCAASVSAHYVVRSSDGQVTQMVREADTAWHVASHNSYSVGIEHEGYAADCAWYTTAMFNGSSLLTRDIADSHGIPRTATYDASQGWDTELAQSSSFKIKGHTNFPTTKTCPGICFDWPRFRSLVIGATYTSTVDNLTAGRFTASANWATSSYSTQRYGSDYRYANPQAVSDAAWFKFNLPATANYEVYVWYPANSGYNSATPFVLATSGGNVTRNVNQQVNGGVWVSLGIHHFNAGDYNTVGVSRWSTAAGYVIADAARMVQR